jgi:hypothetical protein
MSTVHPRRIFSATPREQLPGTLGEETANGRVVHLIDRVTANDVLKFAIPGL